MNDFVGHHVAPSPAFRPRPGSWVAVKLRDPALLVKLAELGAFVTRDGCVCCVFQAAHVPSPVAVTRAGGAVERDKAEPVPDRLVVVDKSGHNVPRLVTGPQGQGVVEDVWFHPSSPAVEGGRPIDDLRDLPPGRVVNTRWAESLHNGNKQSADHVRLPDDVHDMVAATPGGGLRVEEIWEAHEKLARAS